MKAFISAILAVAGWLIGLAFVAFIGLVLLNKFGIANSFYRCPGRIASTNLGGGSQKSTAFLKIQTFRTFVFWAKDSGMAWVETHPQGDFLFFKDMAWNNDAVIGFTAHGTSLDISKNSLIARMNLPGDRYFSGECTRQPR